MRRLALPFAVALIAGSITTARATPAGPTVSPASSPPTVVQAAPPTQEASVNPGSSIVLLSLIHI